MPMQGGTNAVMMSCDDTSAGMPAETASDYSSTDSRRGTSDEVQFPYVNLHLSLSLSLLLLYVYKTIYVYVCVCLKAPFSSSGGLLFGSRGAAPSANVFVKCFLILSEALFML